MPTGSVNWTRLVVELSCGRSTPKVSAVGSPAVFGLTEAEIVGLYAEVSAAQPVVVNVELSLSLLDCADVI